MVVNQAADEWKVLYKPRGSKGDEKEVKFERYPSADIWETEYYELRVWCSEEE